MATKRYRPFANGSQYYDWEGANCVNCTMYSDDATTCPLMRALALAACTDGTISDDEARRIGYLKADGADHALSYVWPCRSVEWTEDWRATHGNP